MEDTIDVSQRIYDYAAKEIEAFCVKNGGSMQKQYENFSAIASQVSAYLMGNSISGLSASEQDEELRNLADDARRIAAFIQANTKKESK